LPTLHLLSRRQRRAENLETAPAVVGLKAHVGDVRNDLDDICEPGATTVITDNATVSFSMTRYLLELPIGAGGDCVGGFR
jgi:hypothetical protein